MPNHLQHETSPYLRQHAENPVDWYPWGEEAFRRAKEEDKPILLSIGYSSCHWCHVMAHESFEDPATARVMNENYVSIKVDREERPDLDNIYMDAVQTLTGHGGWPLTVFLTPEGKPYFGGTYFPSTARYGLPSFRHILEEMAEEYRQKRRETENTADWLVTQIRQTPVRATGSLPGPEVLASAYNNLRRTFDPTFGGFGPAPKFPQPMIVEFLLRLHHRGSGADGLLMVETTLGRMAGGGIYDQLGGGFHRYSVDQRWTVPHFEKMLYDNAQLARLYLHAYQVTGNPLYRRIVTETLDYVRREMRSPEGGFYTAQDADSEGGEGAYYVWTPVEVRDVLGEEEAKFASYYFGITRSGNFEGKSIPTRHRDDAGVAAEYRVSLAELTQRAERSRQRLRERRDQRPQPGTDTKIIAGWNGLMLGSFAEAGAALANPVYLETARENARYLLSALYSDGNLWHTSDARPPRVAGFLQDYAFVVEGLLALHRATLEGEWLRRARELAMAMLERFWSDRDKAFYDTAAGHEELIVRPRTVVDSALPAGASAATLALYYLAGLEGNEGYRQVAETSLAGVVRTAAKQPHSFAYWLCAFDFATTSPRELAVVGPPDDPATQALLRTAVSLYQPNLVVVGQEGAEGSPLLEGRPAQDGRPTAYYCVDFTCRRPTTSADELLAEMAS